jgi:hypothetical protein
MNKKNLGQILTTALVAVSAAAPALALDYEAKPVHWVLMSPWRTAGALSGGLFTGLVSGPIDGGYHGGLRGTKHVAGEFGDEKGDLQLATAGTVAGPGAAVIGGTESGYHGFFHGLKTGWDKPFSRWSYVTMEEK